MTRDKEAKGAPCDAPTKVPAIAAIATSRRVFGVSSDNGNVGLYLGFLVDDRFRFLALSIIECARSISLFGAYIYIYIYIFEMIFFRPRTARYPLPFLPKRKYRFFIFVRGHARVEICGKAASALG